MLMCNFKSHTDLGISDKEHRALIKVLGMLERGELKHVIPGSQMAPFVSYDKSEVGKFNMNWWSNKTDCGTVCCIGGTVEAVMGCNFQTEHMTPNITRLFYPGTGNMDEITPAQAATALRSYLSTGEPHWNEAMEAA